MLKLAYNSDFIFIRYLGLLIDHIHLLKHLKLKSDRLISLLSYVF